MSHIIIQGPYVAKGEQYSEPFVEIVTDGDKVHLRRINAGFDNVVFTIDPALHFKPWQGAAIYWSALGEFIYCDDLYESRDKDAYIRYSFACHEGYILSVGWGETPDDLAVISFRAARYDGDYKRFNRTDMAQNFVDEVIPGFAARRLKYVEARRNALTKITPLDSISELEKQVDLLSTMVFDLVSRLPEQDKPVWFEAYRSAVNDNASTKFKSVAQNIADIAETKGKIREIQSDYFTKKNS